MNAQEILFDVISNLCHGTDIEGWEIDDAIKEFKQRVQVECQQLDGKRNGLVWSRKDGRVTEGFFAVIPEDRKAVTLLTYYLGLCVEDCEQGQLDGIHRVIKRFREWQDANPDKVKVPDLKPEDNAI